MVIMIYKVLYSKKAFGNLKKLDSHNKLYILSWIDKHLVDTTDPYKKGKMLKGNLKNSIRYRVGDYRIIADIQNDKLIILIINIKHRKNVYL